MHRLPGTTRINWCVANWISLLILIWISHDLIVQFCTLKYVTCKCFRSYTLIIWQIVWRVGSRYLPTRQIILHYSPHQFTICFLYAPRVLSLCNAIQVSNVWILALSVEVSWLIKLYLNRVRHTYKSFIRIEFIRN